MSNLYNDRMDQPYIARSLKQLIAIATPGRDNVIDAVDVLGPSTVTQLAEFIGCSRNGLYYHIRALRDCGLLIETTQSGKGSRDTAVYDLPGRPLIVQFELSSKRARNAVIALGLTRLRAAGRSFTRACSSADAVTEGPRRNLWATRRLGRLSEAELEEANELLVKLYELFRPEPQQNKTPRKQYELTFALALAPTMAGIPTAEATKTSTKEKKKEALLERKNNRRLR
jgi:hypothetical protein